MIDLELDRRIPVPLYYQLQQQLRQAILDGRMAPGASLPPEPDLADSAGVSRFTVRQAVEQLVREGLVRRERGRGTFVADLADTAGAIHGFQFSHVLDRTIDDGKVRVTQQQSVTAPDAMRQLLPPGSSAPVHEIVRIHESRQKPTAVETIHLPSSLVPDITRIDLAAPRLHAILEQEFGLRVTHAEEALRAITLTAEEGSPLGLKSGSAAFRIDRRSWAGTNLLEMSTITIPGTLTLTRILDSAAQLTVF